MLPVGHRDWSTSKNVGGGGMLCLPQLTEHNTATRVSTCVCIEHLHRREALKIAERSTVHGAELISVYQTVPQAMVGTDSPESKQPLSSHEQHSMTAWQQAIE